MPDFVPEGYAVVEDRRIGPSPADAFLRPPICIRIKVEKVWNAKDQTVFVRYDDIGRWLNGESARLPIPEALLPSTGVAIVAATQQTLSPDPKTQASNHLIGAFLEERALEAEIILCDDACQCRGRAVICLCANKEWVSITLRREGKLTSLNSTKFLGQKALNARQLKYIAPKPTAFTEEEFESAEDQQQFLNPVGDLYNLLYERILQGKTSPQGLIVVAGSTGTGKSKVARGLIDRYLRELLEKQPPDKPVQRRPHLVTYEDPIEKRFFSDKKRGGSPVVFWPQLAAQRGIDYTPRQRGDDVRSLEDAFLHAKRQTPAVFYIGEIRKETEWKGIIRFAGEGNLVIVTTHANSVVECMKKIFAAVEAKTPVDRGQIAGRLLSVIHLRPYSLEVSQGLGGSPINTFKRQVTLPALWRQTTRGINALVSDGLASILPYNLSSGDSNPSSIGRRWFAGELLKKAKPRHSELENDLSATEDNPTFQAIKDKLIQTAIEWDVEEM